MLLRKQESGDGMRSMDLPYVGEDEALSWCRGYIMHANICLPTTTQHNTPLLTVLYWQPTPTYVSRKVDKCGIRQEKAKIKDLLYFDNHLLSLCSSFPSYKAQLGVVGLVTVIWEPSSRGSSWTLSQSAALIVPIHSPLLILHAFIFLACFVSGFRCKVLCSIVV